MPELLQVRDLNVALDRSAVVSGVSFDLAAGTITGLFGESGCGKTTLAQALLKLLPTPRYRTTGRVEFEGRNLLSLSERQLQPIRGARISMVFQDPLLSLNPVLRVHTQVREVARAHDASPPELPDVRDAYPHQLSGGERQRVTLAQALACNPSLVIADEPFTALDPARVAELCATFRQQCRTQATAFLVISHDEAVLEALADRVLTMHAGRLVERGRPRVSSPAPAPCGDSKTGGEAFLRIRGLTCRSRIHDVDLDLAKGERLGLIGPSGAGKSTLVRCLAGFERPDSGEILLEGRADWPRHEVQMIFQQPAASLNPRFTAEEIIAEPLVIQGRGTSVTRSGQARELMAALGLDPKAAHLPALAFSGGERQRLAIARALAVQPKLLILDESLSSLDSGAQSQIIDLLGDLQRQRGLTYILVSHDPGLVGRFASRTVLMTGGTLGKAQAA
ncbi:MAG TPA: ABC transporter ATP-binding protein [Candidatus Sulfopaludibacter sp.]|jgi:peptide/nickel transport system ATP-binding protein|nr:ABC transporter ATP-binding protein [Candidatus Sulfopaludibacter sp.]